MAAATPLQRPCGGGATPVQEHWSDGYLGREYEDCGALVEDAQRAEFRRWITLPAPSDSPRETARLAAALAGEIARALPDHDLHWLDGDVALLKPLGCRRLAGHHAGVLCRLRGGWHVLHWRPGAGAVRTPLRRLAEAGYRLDGAYRLL